MRGVSLLLAIFIVLPQENLAGNFLVLGDWGGLPIPPYVTEVEESTAKQMATTAGEKQSEFIIALGDNFYFTGVDNEFDKRFHETYSDVFSQSSLQVPWYVIAGNHDHYGNITGQVEYSKHSDIWKFPSLWYSKQFSFKDTSRTLKLIMLDTIVLCGNTLSDFMPGQPKGPESFSAAEEQWTWLQNELEASGEADYLLVGGHFPVWSMAEHGPTSCLVDRLRPLLEEYHVSAYINGHDHNLQHIKETNGTVHYFTIGCANFVNTSEKHIDEIPENSLQFSWAHLERKGGFVSADVADNGLTVTFMDSLGAVLHQQVIEPRNQIVSNDANYRIGRNLTGRENLVENRENMIKLYCWKLEFSTAKLNSRQKFRP